MRKAWIDSSEWGNFIDANSDIGYSYREVPRVQCPRCKKKYPTVSYIMDANYCPNCGEKINIEQ